jgi:leader peptidase (prepilin peptidase)/N-methyltransferase
MPDTIGNVPLWLVKAVVLALGASFANVLVHRVPKGESIVRPGSRCPSCGKAIRWFDNVPVLSYVLLLGRCRSCKATISLRYPLIELCVAVLSLASFYLGLSRAPMDPDLGAAALLWFFPFAFCYLLVVVTFIDLEHFRIPYVFVAIGVVLAFLSAGFADAFSGVGLLDAGLGLVAGAVPFVLVIEVYLFVTKREGGGYGDVALLAMVGATLGYKALPFVLLAASLQGLLVMFPYLVFGGKSEPPWEKGDATEPASDTPAEEKPPPRRSLRHIPVPFGPFIALGAMEWLFFGKWIESIWMQ